MSPLRHTLPCCTPARWHAVNAATAPTPRSKDTYLLRACHVASVTACRQRSRSAMKGPAPAPACRRSRTPLSPACQRSPPPPAATAQNNNVRQRQQPTAALSAPSAPPAAYQRAFTGKRVVVISIRRRALPCYAGTRHQCGVGRTVTIRKKASAVGCASNIRGAKRRSTAKRVVQILRHAVRTQPYFAIRSALRCPSETHEPAPKSPAMPPAR